MRHETGSQYLSPFVPGQSSELPPVAAGTAPLPTVTVVEHDPSWPSKFQEILQKLEGYLSTSGVRYTAIEHVGSTAVPGLAAKPNIDIIIEVPDAENAAKAKEALIHEPSPEEHYKCWGDGGIKGRISMKPHSRNEALEQSVYIINQQDSDGRMIARCHRALRDTLRMPQHEALRAEYGRLKVHLAYSSIDGVDYGQKKNPLIRRILQAAGWTDEDIDKKECLDYRIPGDYDLPY
ncbi:uncharacterized protein PV06_08509 [Exophiala oligosperma]|uniref:Uncharacterized protein n=2 Tax=Chaetothyriales TaxID=34395 RepID=A0A0D2BR53_9EURO|nr:uncharacterized protein PV06_08509 [Exophiala oligosperma]KAJ9634035.1 hypothetical protein H2204_006583 [Knufia peltigerae]KIW39947.1 hypothetical protein PV06_08509 [Exophiala oligosperma]